MLAEILQQINKEKVWKGVCYFLVILGTLMIQNLLMPHLTILKVRPLIIPAAAVAVGMFEGGTYGAIFGLFLGFFADMSFAENTVLFLVIMGVLGFAAGFAADFYLNRTFIPFMAAAFAGLLFTAVVLFYCSNEAISILENAIALNVPVPEKLKKAIESLTEDK